VRNDAGESAVAVQSTERPAMGRPARWVVRRAARGALGAAL